MASVSFPDVRKSLLQSYILPIPLSYCFWTSNLALIKTGIATIEWLTHCPPSGVNYPNSKYYVDLYSDETGRYDIVGAFNLPKDPERWTCIYLHGGSVQNNTQHIAPEPTSRAHSPRHPIFALASPYTNNCPPYPLFPDTSVHQIVSLLTFGVVKKLASVPSSPIYPEGHGLLSFKIADVLSLEAVDVLSFGFIVLVSLWMVDVLPSGMVEVLTS